MARLPDADTEMRWEAVRRDEAELSPGVRALCADLALSGGIERFADGSLPVYAVGDHRVLKLYPPLYLEECEREHTVLETIHSALPVPSPAPLACGQRDGWGYLLMERLSGRSLASAWPPDRSDQQSLMEQLGDTLRVLHALSPLRPSTLRRDGPGWLVRQAEQAAERQRARGLDERWVEQIDEFLAAFAEAPLPDGREALLHTEVMREHLLVAPTDGGSDRLTGIFDFEPAMMGHPEYEFASAGLFVTCGDPMLLRTLLLAYGLPREALTEALSRRLLAYALLHRYSNFPWYMRRLPPDPSVRTLHDLAGAWFGV